MLLALVFLETYFFIITITALCIMPPLKKKYDRQAGFYKGYYVSFSYSKKIYLVLSWLHH